MSCCRSFGREAPELDWEDFQRNQERLYLGEVSTHRVTVKVTVHLTYADCTPAEAVEYASDYISQALLEADDFDTDMEVDT